MAALLKTVNKAVILMAGCIALAALSSCADDTYSDGRSRNTIGFEITSGDDSSPKSRAPQQTEGKSRLLYAHSKDSLFLHTTISDNTLPAEENKKTRGIPVDSGNFKSVCKEFGVKAYVDGTEKLYMDAKVSSENNGVWTPDGGPRFWPGTQTLDFYACAPYVYKDSVNCDSKSKSISIDYTVPQSAKTGEDATAQPDLLFATASCNVESVNEKGCVPLTFKHALAAIQFKTHAKSIGTIKSIKIKNAQGSGNCTYDGKTFVWTHNGERREYTQNFNVDVDANSHDVTTKKPEATFMMIPQNLNDISIEVVFVTKEDGTTHTLQGKLGNNVWDAGKKYTYTISTESVNWTYVFDITPTLTLPLGKTEGNYTVKSYRYRPSYPDKIEKVKWTAIKTNEADGKFINGFTYKGDGVDGKDNVETNECSFTMLPMKTDYIGDNTLREANAKGSENAPYDLSTDYGKGDITTRTTANCYIVSAPGTYSLPLVYGNAIKNGQNNNVAYSGFKDYKDQNISSPYISGAHDCTLVWSDAFYLFKDVKLKDGKLVFTLDRDYMQQANAIVAVRDKDGKIMWSWHIWVTEHDLSKTVGLQDYFTEKDNMYQLMPYNLGWIDGKSIEYESREIPFTFTQDKSGEERTLNVVQQGDTLDYKDGGSTYYQWGRKDPIVALKNRQEKDIVRPHETWQSNYGYRYEVKKATLGDAIQNPNVYYVSNSGGGENCRWINTPRYDLWNKDVLSSNGKSDENIQTSTKTIYDPSPRWYKVPVPRAFAVFVNGKKGTLDTGGLNGEILNDGYTYNVYTQRDRKGESLKLTATGQRAYYSMTVAVQGGLFNINGVYYWSCHGYINSTGNYNGWSLCIFKSDQSFYTTYGFAGAQAMARPVRCIKE